MKYPRYELERRFRADVDQDTIIFQLESHHAPDSIVVVKRWEFEDTAQPDSLVLSILPEIFAAVAVDAQNNLRQKLRALMEFDPFNNQPYYGE